MMANGNDFDGLMRDSDRRLIATYVLGAIVASSDPNRRPSQKLAAVEAIGYADALLAELAKTAMEKPC